MKITNAQQRMIDRSILKFTYSDSGHRASVDLQKVMDKYNKAGLGYTEIKGSADWRVAYRLEEMGLGRTCTISPHENKFFAYTGVVA